MKKVRKKQNLRLNKNKNKINLKFKKISYYNIDKKDLQKYNLV